MDYSFWSSRIAELAGSVERLEAEAVAAGVASSASASWRANLFQKLAPQATDAPYLIVAVAGGTNIGKSTVFNHLVGSHASRVHPDATQTKHPVCLLPRDFSRRRDLQRVFPAFELRAWRTEDDALAEGPSNLLIYREDASGEQPENLILLDTPDVDGALPVNWERARLIAHAADVLIAVLTQQKYNDAAVRRFFAEAAEADKAILAVFNMVDWPEDREHCLRWLAEFRDRTEADPLHVYAVARDREAVRANRLVFHGLSEGSTDPRDDLSRLRFDEIKIRSLRGALRQMLDPNQGLPARLRELQEFAKQNREARDVIHRKVQIKIDPPRLPGHIVHNEICRWLEPRRTWFDRKVHGAYNSLGRTVTRWLPGTTPPEEQEARYIEDEKGKLFEALEKIYDDLEDVRRAGADWLRAELQPLLAGDQRQRAFDQLRERLAAAPLATNEYARAIAARLDRFQDEHPMMMRTIEWGLVATAVLRPAITIGMFGVADIAAHSAFQVGGHSIGQIAFDAAAGTAMSAVGEGTYSRFVGPAHELIGDLFAEFYRERAALLAGVIQDCVVGARLDHIETLAKLDEGNDFKTAYKVAAELSRGLSAFDEGFDAAVETSAASMAR